MKTVTSTLRLEIVRPLDGSWDELGATLRALRAPLHRVMNAAICDLELAKRAGEDVAEQTKAYRAVLSRWTAERESAAGRVVAGKPMIGDASVAATVPSGAVVTGVAGSVLARWKRFRKDEKLGLSTLPTFKGRAPIIVASKGVDCRSLDGGAVALSLSMTERGTPRVEFVVRPYKDHGHALLRRIVSGEAKLGDCRIQEDDRGRIKWQAFVSLTYGVEEQTGGRTMAVHRGVADALTVAVATDGKRESWTSTLASGGDILAHKAAYRARRASLGRHARDASNGARGHGGLRRLEHITRLEDSEERWVRSKCQTLAARVMEIAKQRGVTRIVLEDWTNPAGPDLGGVEWLVRSFPMAQLRASIEWAARMRGLDVAVVSGAYTSRICPSCGHEHESPPVKKSASPTTGTTRYSFHCEKCQLWRPADYVAAWNLLLRDGKPCPLEDEKRATKRAAGRLRKGARAA